MVLRKMTLVAVLAFTAYAGIRCSSQEDRDQYDKFYGKGRADREEVAGGGSFAARTGDAAEQKIDSDTINSLSVTQNADSEQGTSTAITQGTPQLAGKTIEEVVEAPAKKEEAKPAADAAPKQKPVPADIAALLNKNTCSACHQAYNRVVGPAYADVAKKNYSVAQIVELVSNPKPENWPGYPPMMAMPQVPKEEVEKIAKWINTL